LRAMNLRCGLVAFLRSWLVFGAVTVGVLPEASPPADSEADPGADPEPEPDADPDAEPDPVPDAAPEAEPPGTAAEGLAVDELEPVADDEGAATGPSPWPPHAAVARTTVSTAPRMRG
jgi:hypothetical protein